MKRTYIKVMNKECLKLEWNRFINFRNVLCSLFCMYCLFRYSYNKYSGGHNQLVKTTKSAGGEELIYLLH